MVSDEDRRVSTPPDLRPKLVLTCAPWLIVLVCVCVSQLYQRQHPQLQHQLERRHGFQCPHSQTQVHTLKMSKLYHSYSISPRLIINHGNIASCWFLLFSLLSHLFPDRTWSILTNWRSPMLTTTCRTLSTWPNSIWVSPNCWIQKVETRPAIKLQTCFRNKNGSLKVPH